MSSHFVVSNYNNIPSKILEFATTYTLFDQSDDSEIATQVQSRYPSTIVVENVGHSLANFLNFIADEYERLPATVALLKSNIIDRHVSEAYFSHRIGNTTYTPLFQDEVFRDSPYTTYALTDGLIIEINNSWYVDKARKPYVSSFNSLLKLLYEQPVLPEWVAFAPGGCYIVPKENIRRVPRYAYRDLAWLTSYTYFPPEAYLVERVLHTLFTASYQMRSWCFAEGGLREAIETMGTEPHQATGTRRWLRLQQAIKVGRAAYQHRKDTNLEG